MFKLGLMEPSVQSETYVVQTLRWKRLFDRCARLGEQANARTWKALFRHFRGDFDELNRMVNSVVQVNDPCDSCGAAGKDCLLVWKGNCPRETGYEAYLAKRAGVRA